MLVNTSTGDYEKLFKEFNEKFGTNVVDLPGYYKELQKVRANDSLNKKFLRIPLDEENFHIDANSRAINIPFNFALNGLGVAGDHTAEVIFFDIDRFFDEMDFHACTCRIQWISPSGNQGVSEAYAVEATEEQVIFGWILSNQAMDEPGNLQFSIRFYIEDEETGELLYNYSTKTATCTVQRALQIQDVNDIEVEDLSNLMKTRVLYSD